MLAGQPPFTGPTAESLAHQHLSVAPRPVTELRPAVPAAVAAALQRALAKVPADRYATATQFTEALGQRETELPLTVVRPRPSVPRPHRARWALAASAIVLVIVAAVFATTWVVRGPRGRAPTRTPATAHTRSEVAVLPFQNLSAGGPHAYFAGGLHEELLTQLAKVAALKIISRTSVMGYAATTKPLKQVAAELGVGSIVEGSVQVVGNRLRVNVQLIDAATDEHVWAERYDRSLDDAFAIQSDVAQRIVAAVGAVLATDERRAIGEAPTANPEAYRLYLQGEEYRRRPGFRRKNLEDARRHYERALALDSTFALVHARLSEVHGLMYWFRYDPAESRAARMRGEAETALRLAPDLPQGHVAMGLAHYFGRRDYGRALGEFSIALRGLPNDGELWGSIGYVHRRLGNWDEVEAAFEKATQLDPRNVDTQYELGASSYAFTRRYAKAVRVCEQALALAPDFRLAAIQRGWIYVLWQGQLDTLRAELARLPGDADPGERGTVVCFRAEVLLWERDADGLLPRVAACSGQELRRIGPFPATRAVRCLGS